MNLQGRWIFRCAWNMDCLASKENSAFERKTRECGEYLPSLPARERVYQRMVQGIGCSSGIWLQPVEANLKDISCWRVTITGWKKGDSSLSIVADKSGNESRGPAFPWLRVFRFDFLAVFRFSCYKYILCYLLRFWYSGKSYLKSCCAVITVCGLASFLSWALVLVFIRAILSSV